MYKYSIFLKFARLHFPTLPAINHVFLFAHDNQCARAFHMARSRTYNTHTESEKALLLINC